MSNHSDGEAAKGNGQAVDSRLVGSRPVGSRPVAGSPIGYCTNVHAGTDLAQILANLQGCALRVREHLGKQELGIGLWFSQAAALEMLAGSSVEKERRIGEFRDGLSRMGLVPYTLNGFPQKDFHQSVVKHRVYEPAWWEPERFEYTKQLVSILDALLPLGVGGSISTLPISWSHTDDSPGEVGLTVQQQAADQLLELALHLHGLYEQSGRRIVIALEPEPGCLFTDHASLRSFYERFWSEPAIDSKRAAIAREYLTICHDICHSAVMAEDQKLAIELDRRLGIRVGKVQVSSAIRVDWAGKSHEERVLALEQLGLFAEDRYLHQTLVIKSDGSKELFEDLPKLLSRVRGGEVQWLDGCQWRIHFHVPIYAERLGAIDSTRGEILNFLDCVRDHGDWFDGSEQYEVETYAWSVLPKSLASETLDVGISRELRWLEEAMKARAIQV